MKRTAAPQGSRRIGIALLVLLVFMLFMHVVSVWLQANGQSSEFTRLFDLDSEQAVPATYNGLLWAATATALLILANRRQAVAARMRWLFLATLFIYFAFDEILVLHERLARPIRELLSIKDGSIFYHAWIVPAIAVAIGITLVALYIRGRDRISTEQKTLFSLLIMLAFGTVLLEAAGTQLYFSQTVYKLGPVLIEELFEMGMISHMLYRSYGYLE